MMDLVDAYACLAEADSITCHVDRATGLLDTALRYGFDFLREASLTPEGGIVD